VVDKWRDRCFVILAAMNSLNPPKFPHDRVVFFSDAVFAIAITLLVIEIKVPTHENLHALGTAQALKKLTPLFIGYVISFLVCALFWRSHLQLGQHVKEFSVGLIWLNIFLLLFVALMPFSTALYSEHFGDNIAFAWYCCNLAAIGFMNFAMHGYVLKRASIPAWTPRQIAWYRNRTLVVPTIFLLSILVSLVSPVLSRMTCLLIFVVLAIGDRVYKI